MYSNSIISPSHDQQVAIFTASTALYAAGKPRSDLQQRQHGSRSCFPAQNSLLDVLDNSDWVQHRHLGNCKSSFVILESKTV